MSHEDEILNDPDSFVAGGDFSQSWRVAEVEADRSRRPVGVALAAAAVLLVLGRSVWVGLPGADAVPMLETAANPTVAVEDPLAPPPEAQPSVPEVEEESVASASGAPARPDVEGVAAPEVPVPPEAPENVGIVRVLLDGVEASSAQVNCNAGTFRERAMFSFRSATIEGVPEGSCHLVLNGAGTKKKFSFSSPDIEFTCSREDGGTFHCAQRPLPPPPPARPSTPEPPRPPAPPATPPASDGLVPVLVEAQGVELTEVGVTCTSSRDRGAAASGGFVAFKVPENERCRYEVRSGDEEVAVDMRGAAILRCTGEGGLTCSAPGFDVVPAGTAAVDVHLDGVVASSFQVSCGGGTFRERATFRRGQARMTGVPEGISCQMVLNGAGSKKVFRFTGTRVFKCFGEGGSLRCL